MRGVEARILTADWPQQLSRRPERESATADLPFDAARSRTSPRGRSLSGEPSRCGAWRRASLQPTGRSSFRADPSERARLLIFLSTPRALERPREGGLRAD